MRKRLTPSKKFQLTLHQRKRVKQLALALPFLLPNLIGFLTFTLVPVIASFVLSFTRWDVLTPPRFIGLDNYIELVTVQVVTVEHAAGLFKAPAKPRNKLAASTPTQSAERLLSRFTLHNRSRLSFSPIDLKLNG